MSEVARVALGMVPKSSSLCSEFLPHLKLKWGQSCWNALPLAFLSFQSLTYGGGMEGIILVCVPSLLITRGDIPEYFLPVNEQSLDLGCRKNSSLFLTVIF